MIEGATIERFRGIQQLDVDGFGRVNLIIGKNDCGKTALMEALAIAESPEGASFRAYVFQSLRLRLPREAGRDFNRFWRHLFWRGDPEQGLVIAVSPAGARRREVRFTTTSPPDAIEQLYEAGGEVPAWTIEVKNGDTEEQISGTPAGLKLPPLRGAPSTWVSPSKFIGPDEIRHFSKLKQSGRDRELFDLLRVVDERVVDVEILAPTGATAELFVSLGRDAPLLPLAVMGDGVQHCFEIGTDAAAHEGPTLFLDEIDNGLHHSTLEPVWRWLATISKQRDLQVFATTHSEECIHAAARAFTALNDDDLRVIRLDRREDRITAAIYDRDLVDTAMRTGVEIRG